MIYSAHTGLPHHLAPQPLSGEIPLVLRRDELDDWAELLKALTARLRAAASEELADVSSDGASRLRHVVLECAGDLDILFGALRAGSMPHPLRVAGALRVITDPGLPLEYRPSYTSIEVKATPWWEKRPAVFSRIFS
ncbi:MULTISPECIES: hypothetical protein [Variovorax]|uniref:hypothetical protein n=1 Tax=Variovorax TaxID=34072 RepID=UPI002480B42F|nr:MULTISPECIES: hypothetical protein [Variovorax]MDR6890808.1 hypothetical protein [Variovorax sp. 3319]WGT62461.1 hypothetical protein QHG62_20735 [Variovorax paradoxus]